MGAFKHRGINLIELMIVIACISILAAVFLPIYQKHQKEKEVAQSVNKEEAKKKE